MTQCGGCAACTPWVPCSDAVSLKAYLQPELPPAWEDLSRWLAVLGSALWAPKAPDISSPYARHILVSGDGPSYPCSRDRHVSLRSKQHCSPSMASSRGQACSNSMARTGCEGTQLSSATGRCQRTRKTFLMSMCQKVCKSQPVLLCLRGLSAVELLCGGWHLQTGLQPLPGKCTASRMRQTAASGDRPSPQ